MAQVTVDGLSSNGYVINNPIFLNLNFISSEINDELLFFTIKITDASTQENIEIKIAPIPNNNTLKVDISDLVKAFFVKPKHNENYLTSSFFENNRKVFNFFFTASFFNYGSEFSVVHTLNGKVFFRAGFDNNKVVNQTLTQGTILRRTETLPYWASYPTAEYSIDSEMKIVKNPLIDSVENKERRIAFNCNNYYVKFLNSLGGYSYWLFQGMTVNKTTTNLGYSNVFNDFHDFGNKTKRTISLYSKVPARFYPLIEDLVESREIYLYNFEGVTWQPIKNENNKTERNDIKKNYEVKLNFELISGYNPSGWSR